MITRSERATHREVFISTLADVEAEAFDIPNECGAPLDFNDDPANDLVRLDGEFMNAAVAFLSAAAKYRAEHDRLKAAIAADCAENYADPLDFHRRKPPLGYGHLHHERL